MAILLLVPMVLLGGCSKWRKYWDRSPTRPQFEIDSGAPTIRISSPSGPDSAHATPVSGDTFTVLIESHDDGGVTGVELHVDDGPAIAVAGPPWSHTWDTTVFAEGSIHRLWAAATDPSGNRGVSATVFAAVFNAGPAIALSAPANDAFVLGTVRLAAAPTGPSAEFERMEFLADDQVAAEITTAPWEAMLDTRAMAPGAHFVVARATTVLGAVGVSPPVRIVVNNGAPAVSITFPAPGHRLASRGTLILSGTGTDVVEGGLPADRFHWTSSIGGALGDGAYLRIGGLAPGTHTITATAANAWGTAGTATVQVDVTSLPTYSYCGVLDAEIFRTTCLSCHKPNGLYWPLHRLDLRSYATLRAGGVTTAYEMVVPCKPESSLLLNKLSTVTPWVGERMPMFSSALSPSLLDKLQTWILEGAPPDDPPTCP